jgi:hypothetical protein
MHETNETSLAVAASQTQQHCFVVVVVHWPRTTITSRSLAITIDHHHDASTDSFLASGTFAGASVASKKECRRLGSSCLLSVW